MMIAVLVLAFIAFVAFVNFIISAQDWSLYVVFIAAGLGLVLWLVDWVRR